MSSESHKEATLSGVRWVMLTRIASETLALGATVALARLLSPAQFSHAAVALIFMPLATILTFEGFASALVQRESIADVDVRAAVAMSLAGGGALSALAAALTPLWGLVFGSQTAAMMLLMSPVFLLASIGGVSRALLWRKLEFRRTSVIEMCALATGSVTALALALAGAGPRAIVLGALAQVALGTALLFAAAPAPLPRWHRRSQREIGGFGVPAALAGLVDVLFRNVDYAIVAARLPAAQTGIYWRAFNLGVVYQDKLSGVMMQLAFPVYSRTESRAELRRLHERATRVHAAVIFPLLASLIVFAPIVIPLVLGSAWTPSVGPTQILAVAGMVAAILTGYPQVMLAVGRPRALLNFNLAMLAVYATVVALAVGHGLIAVAIAVVIVYLGILVGVYHFLLARYVGLSIKRLLPELGPALAGCVALAAVTEPLRLALEPSLPRILTLAVAGGAGLLAYAGTLRVVSPAAWRDLALLLVRVFPPLGRLHLRRGGVVAAAEPSRGAVTTQVEPSHGAVG
ncbi:MAG TPA: oligosaccharide flippase family protein [Solirubrobacteraceae bacterium]|jgi:teichuronic acid exporter|nr:oligosaccharide flippase family protein [Solirubrobacteraceae bacterium]